MLENNINRKNNEIVNFKITTSHIERPDLCTVLIPNNNYFKIIHINIRSFIKNFEKFVSMQTKVKLEVDVIKLAECLFNKSGSTSLN